MPKESSTAVASFGSKSLEDMNFDEMMEAGVIDISVIDDVVVADQEELEGVPFILYNWEMKTGDRGSYVVCRVKTRDGTRVFADGGKGIGEQLEKYKQRLLDAGEDPYNTPIRFSHGLRASRYIKEIDGKSQNATTWYLDNKPA